VVLLQLPVDLDVVAAGVAAQGRVEQLLLQCEVGGQAAAMAPTARYCLGWLSSACS
jgi:hypothetical protein